MITVAIEPEVSSEDDNAAGIAAFVFEMGILKRLRRAGWWHVGVETRNRLPSTASGLPSSPR